jgi:mitochondrial distribution and morphology protein 31
LYSSNAELKQRYLIIRSYFISVNNTALTNRPRAAQNKLAQIRAPSSLRSASLSTEIKSPKNEKQPGKTTDDAQAHDQPSGSSNESNQKRLETQTHEYPSYIRRLISSSPPLHRPTRDEMLALATGFWERLKIRFKWFTIRGFRKFDTDDMSAFLSWFVVSQAVWIMVGTYVDWLF